MDIFVGNFPFETTDEQLSEVFAPHGAVDQVKIIYDRETGRSRGFAFVSMADPQQAQDAIRALDGADFGGRPLRVNEARKREERPPRQDFREPRRGGRGEGRGYDDGGGGGGGGGDFGGYRERRGGGGGHRDRRSR
ncbi:MAG TPA: RNA-binding protein [Verrucomicrobiales bacterium]|nr:RNA-binding protein [Verrucomicrobiales bacterium]